MVARVGDVWELASWIAREGKYGKDSGGNWYAGQQMRLNME